MLTIVPLGGLGEVGMNCMAIEVGEDLFVVDVGVTFPGRTHGIDLEHPRFDWILERQARLRAILITHGHEDHIGGLPYLLRALEKAPPVYGPPYALALIRRRFEEHEVGEVELHPTRPGERFTVGCIDVEPVRVNHSIPDCTSLILRTPEGTVVHSGDFKIEEAPLDGEAFGAEALRRAGDEGVDLLLSDSTNIDVEGDTGEEHEVATELHARMGAARGRFVVAQFASNVHRMGAVFEAARAHGRRVALLGRSVRTHSEVARNLRILEGIADLIVPPDDIQDVPPAKLCVIATGTQGERPAALSRLARNDHGLLQLEPGDTVVMSSRIIPGCERAVYQMIDGLERQGITVIHRKNAPGVHVSGHAARDEQRAYIELCRPKAFLPVHGTYHHLQRHAALAESLGVRETLVVENGTVIQLQNAHLQVVDHAVAGRVHIDRGEEVDPEQLRERRLVGELGHAVVAFPVNENGAIVGEVDVVARGVLHEEVEDDILEAACHYVASELARAPRSDTIDDLEDRARRSLKRFFGKQLRRKPIVTAVAVRVRR